MSTLFSDLDYLIKARSGWPDDTNFWGHRNCYL